MIRLVILALALGTTSAQFARQFRFGSRRDSIEDNSDERFFGSSRNFARRDFDDSAERSFGVNRNFISREFDDSDERRRRGRTRGFPRFNDSPEIKFGFRANSISREFDDSHERSFRRNRNFRTRNLDDSFEDNFLGRRTFGRRDFDDSNESFFSRRNFLNRNTGRTHQTIGRNFGTTQTAGSPNFITRQNFGTSRNRNFLHDSLEDIVEDLFDDDLDDRIRAQNALSHFQTPGTNSFSTRGTNNGFRFGTTRTQSNTFARPGTRPNNVFSSRNQNNGAFAFRTSLGRNNNNRIGSTRRISSQRNNFGINQTPKQPRRFTINSIRGQGVPKPSSGPTISSFNANTNRRSQSPRTGRVFGNTGFNWPGGNGYFVSMRTGAGKPTTYFVKFDD